MREVHFVRQRAGDWKEFEALLDRRPDRRVDPDQMADLYVRVTDDLAYAQTFYPASRTTAYLNSLAMRLHQALYRNRREDRSRFVRFWTTELPLTLHRERRSLRASAIVFAVAVLIGTLSSAGDPAFLRVILGDLYVEMTLDNIERGDPMAVYKQMAQTDMFLGITFNNVLVAFRAFAFGIFVSIGTVYILFINGIMLGAFQTFFHGQGLLLESARVIWIHGALEIPAIVIAGAAGLAMGNAILFPGTYPRWTSFLGGARRGLKIIVGLVPVFVVAGFLEGFVTRHTEMPLALSLLIIFGSFAFIAWYFVLLPARVARRYPAAEA